MTHQRGNGTMSSTSAPAGASGTPARILVVEHDHAAAAAMCAQLVSLGYSICAQVDSGEAAIGAALAQRPDLVVINAVLPGAVSGVAAAEAISRQLGAPLLFLSAYSDPDTVRQAINAQPYGYLTKPFDIRELYAQIEVALAKGRADRQVREALQWYAATLRGVGDSVIV
ncbi:response regulator, partial [Duganella sp. FT134W]